MPTRWLSTLLPLTLAACTGGAGPPGAEGARGAEGSQGAAGPEGAGGPEGADGSEGAEGPEGPQGPAGPIGTPPALVALSPTWGSALTQVTLTGAGFSAAAIDDRVLFGGHAALVISATETELVVQPDLATDEELPVGVTVEVGRQLSNTLLFDLVPSGSARPLVTALPTAPTAAVEVGSDVYVAAGSPSLGSAGLYRRDAGGAVSQVLAARRIDVTGGGGGGGGGGGPSVLFDGPIALATDGTDVYFTTALGAVRRYAPADGAVEELLAPLLGGGGGGELPSRTGIAFDDAGTLYVLDRSLDAVVAVDAAGGVDVIALTAGGSVGLASDGTDLFLSNELTGSVTRIGDPGGSPAVSDDFATGASSPRGIALVGGAVVVSAADGTLSSADAAIGGALVGFGAPGGYGYQADQLSVTGAGDLLLAQPRSSAVRRIAAGQTDAVIIAAGTRLAFGTARIGDDWYFSTVGIGLFGAGPPTADAAPDGAILEVAPDGTSRVLATARFPVGLLAGAAGELTFSDCFDVTISTLTIATGATSVLLGEGDGLTCPTGLAADGAGDLFYVNTSFEGGGPTTIGRRTFAGANDVAFVTGLSPGTVQLALSGTTLLAAPFGDASASLGFAISSAGAGAAGTATELVAAATAGAVSALGVAPDGRVLVARVGFGELLELDVATGALTPFGSSLAPGASFGGGVPALALSMGFLGDGTIVLADPGQATIVGVAP